MKDGNCTGKCAFGMDKFSSVVYDRSSLYGACMEVNVFYYQSLREVLSCA